MSHLHSRYAAVLCLGFGLVMGYGSSRADEPPAERARWDGRYEYVLTGAPLAKDTDADGNVDSLLELVQLPLPLASLPPGAVLERALLYWGGTQAQSGSGATTLPDSAITLDLPGGDSALVQAQVAMFSDGGSASYDVWICRADVTHLFGASAGQITGTCSVSGYQGLVNDNASDNASAALVLVFSDPTFAYRSISLFDGNLTLQSSADTLAWSAVRPALRGSLTYYSLEGDPGGSSSEKVVVAVPGGTPLVLVDLLNPAGNPMNQTINVTSPVQTGTIGVDIDRFSVDSALSGVDSSIQITFGAGSDKWWLAAFVMAAEVAAPADVDADGIPDSLDNCAAVANPDQFNADADPYGAACDCNDGNPAVHPGALELCNGADDNCDGAVDPGCCSISIPGDNDMSGQVTSSDIIKLVNYLYRSGPQPLPCLTNGDVNCDGRVSTEDVVYEVTYVFKNGPAPCDVCVGSSIPCVAATT